MRVKRFLVVFAANDDIAYAISTASRQEREPILLWNSEFSRQGASSLPFGQQTFEIWLKRVKQAPSESHIHRDLSCSEAG